MGPQLFCASDLSSIIVPKLVFQRRQWHPTPVPLPGKFHGWRSLAGYSPWGHKEADTTKWLHFLSFYNCSCLENPMDRGAWWATVYGPTCFHCLSKLVKLRLQILPSFSSYLVELFQPSSRCLPGPLDSPLHGRI